MTIFGDVELTTMAAVGAVTPRSARIWVRTDTPGPAQLTIETDDGRSVASVPVVVPSDEGDHTAAWTYPDDFDGATPLEPNTRHRLWVTRGTATLGEAAFSTAPSSRASAPRRWTFGAFSCHQPFGKDGEVHEGSLAMMRAAREAFEEAGARFCLMMGDQIYADYPEPTSLFNPSYFPRVAPPGRASLLECDRAQVRAIYQRRHRQFWGLPEHRALHTLCASYPILDDHEIIDNFGTHPDHAEPAWESVRGGALDAFYDYQASRVVSDSSPPFDYGFTWGPAAFYVMDIRSDRRTRDGKTNVYSEAQLRALHRFLEENGEAGLLALVTTIPLVYIEGKVVKAASSVLSEGSDLHERWSHPSCVESRDRLFRMLYQHSARHPHQTVLLLGGDVHAGAAYEVQFEDGRRWHQLVSSAISNRESAIMGKASELASRTVSTVRPEGCPEMSVRQIPGVAKDVSKNPFGGLNVGLVDVVDHGERVALRLCLLGYEEDGAPRTVFDSGEIG